MAVALALVGLVIIGGPIAVLLGVTAAWLGGRGVPQSVIAFGVIAAAAAVCTVYTFAVVGVSA